MSGSDRSQPFMSRRTALRSTAAAALIGATLGTSAGAVAASNRPAASSGPDADVGFCTDMAAHHVQALAMCQRVIDRDTGDPVQAAAGEVLQNQAIEVGMMRAWLTDWERSTATPDTVMGWMGANDGAGVPIEQMQGYASDDAISALSAADGIERGRIWLELMRAHHVGGVAMATAALDLVSSEKVERLAETQIMVQTYEVEQYDLLIGDDYAIAGWVAPASLTQAVVWYCDLAVAVPGG
ncbi:MAG: DUF305 domain-containing protein [Actinomycetota bacterium]